MIVNLTDHDVVILDEEGNERIVFKPSGHVARIKQARTFMFNYPTKEGDVPIYKDETELDFDGVKIQPLTIYIVSWLFLKELRIQRPDLLNQFVAPNTYNQPKGPKGEVVGVQSFIVL